MATSASGKDSGKREYTIRHVKNLGMDEQPKVYSVLKFPQSCNVDPTRWPSGKLSMSREGTGAADSKKSSSRDGGDEPTHGEGSVYGKAARDRARRIRFAQSEKKKGGGEAVKPWLMRIELPPSGDAASAEGSATATGLRELRSMPSEDAGRFVDYWLLSKRGNEFYAARVTDWHQFHPVVRRRQLNIEEAERHFQQRDKVLNQFALKAQIDKQLEGADGESAAGNKAARSGGTSRLLIKSGDGDDEEDEEEDGEDADEDSLAAEDGTKWLAKVRGQNAKRGKGGAGGGERKRRTFDGDDKVEVAAYESDDGDDEGREYEYISDSGSDSESAEEEKTDKQKAEEAMVSVGDEAALRSNNVDGEEEGEETDEEETVDGEDSQQSKRSTPTGQQGKPLQGKSGEATSNAHAQISQQKVVKGGEESSDDEGSDSDDPDKAQSVLFLKRATAEQARPTKRPAADSSSVPVPTKPEGPPLLPLQLGQPGAKRAKVLEGTVGAASSSGVQTHQALGIQLAAHGAADASDEELIRHCLLKRPYSTKELVKKLSRVGVPKEDILVKLTQILKKLDVQIAVKQRNGKDVRFFTLNR